MWLEAHSGNNVSYPRSHNGGCLSTAASAQLLQYSCGTAVCLTVSGSVVTCLLGAYHVCCMLIQQMADFEAWLSKVVPSRCCEAYGWWWASKVLVTTRSFHLAANCSGCKCARSDESDAGLVESAQLRLRTSQDRRRVCCAVRLSRVVNLELLLKFGPKAWRVHNARLSSSNTRCQLSRSFVIPQQQVPAVTHVCSPSRNM